MKVLGEFQRRGDRVERRFTGSEQKMIGNLVRGLVETLDGADDLRAYEDSVLRRLLPTGAPDDPDVSAEFAGATRERLAAAKSQGAQRLVADMVAAPRGVVSLDDQAAVVWLKALGDLRIALAERVGFDQVQSTGSPQGLVYAWLTWLQGSLVEAVDPDAA